MHFARRTTADGVAPPTECGWGAMSVPPRLRDGAGMTENRAIASPTERRTNVTPVVHRAPQLTGADYDAVARELDALRGRHRAELERRLRDAREFGSPADDDDVLAVFEDIAVEQARLAQLEALLRSASIVDGDAAADGHAGLGSTVHVRARDGRTMDFVLVGRRHATSNPQDVSSGSPVGMALLGTRAGDIVDIVLPNGRRRSLEVLSVEIPARAA
jgi:transcription elongation factor GreA